MSENNVNTETLRHQIAGQRDQIFSDLANLVSAKSIFKDSSLKAESKKAAHWVSEAFSDLGFNTEEIDTADGSTTILAQKTGAENQPTVLLYSHYDVVPVGDPQAWTTDPFILTERTTEHGLRWYGRGAADCKGNVVMHLAALRTIAELGGTNVNLKILVEGSEEFGGEGLSELIKTQPELFDADVFLIADSGNAAVGVPTLTTSLRGGAQLKVSVDTLKEPVHSGTFGGAAPDAVASLVRILDSLRDEHGRTVIDGVDTQATWQGEGYDAESFRTDAGVLDGVELMGDGENPADLVWARPAVTVIGFTSTPVANAVNAVPNTATAQLNLRVPPGQDAEDVAEKLAAHLKNHTPWGAKLTVETTSVNPAFSTDTKGAAVSLLVNCLSQAYEDKETIFQGSGGSIPLCNELMHVSPKAELALYGVEEPLCTIHSVDESVDPTEIENIAAAEALFLLSYGN